MTGIVEDGIKVDYKHRSFNPMWGGLSIICATMEVEGWMLYNVVSVSQYEAVAVFVRPRQVIEEEEPEPEHIGDYL